MKTISKANTFSVAAAALYIFLFIEGLTFMIIDHTDFSLNTIFSILTYISYIGIALMPILNKRNKVFLVFPGITAAITLYRFLSFLITSIIPSFGNYNLSTILIIEADDVISVLCDLSVFIIVLLTFTKHPAKAVSINKLWFLPGVLYVIQNLFRRFALQASYTLLNSKLLGVIIDIIELAAIVSFFLWLKYSTQVIFDSLPEEQKALPAKTTAAITPAASPNTNPLDGILGRASAIAEYKTLLDNGVITQEEFEAKKAELLKI